MPRGEPVELARAAARAGRRRPVPVDRAVGGAPVEPVLAGDRQREPGEQPVGIGDRAPGDERDRAGERARQRRQQRCDGGVDADRVGRGGELEQGAVDVEEQRRSRPSGGGRAWPARAAAPRAAARASGLSQACRATSSARNRPRWRITAASSSMRPAQR